MASSASTYTFQSEPRAVRQNRQKYRDANKSVIGNLMNDPRVIRGNTFRRETLPTTVAMDPVAMQKQQEKRRVMQARARAKAPKSRDVEPVAGRAHIEVQTELYLEELTDRVEETDMAVQTDPFLDRPPSPLFIPAKTGVDVETQIEEGDLFDFDMESKPILEVLVGKTIEQALMEVMEEEELDRLRDHQLEFEELRNAELIETQRLEEQARRRREERERRMKQQAAVAKQERETTKKIAARSFAQSYLSGLVPSVFDNLDSNGYFYDTQEREVEEQFLPWLLDGIESKLNSQSQGRAMLDDLIRHVVAARAARYAPAPADVVETEATEAVVDTEEPTTTTTDDKTPDTTDATQDPTTEDATTGPSDEPNQDQGADAPPPGGDDDAGGKDEDVAIEVEGATVSESTTDEPPSTDQGADAPPPGGDDDAGGKDEDVAVEVEVEVEGATVSESTTDEPPSTEEGGGGGDEPQPTAEE